jgi:hypothetical protein
LFADQEKRGPAEEGEALRAPEQNWFWALRMGLGMLVGAALALAIATTRVVLAYDETFVGLSRAQLDAVNPRLLAFMAHDRVALAGTMLTIGILYTGLAAIGLRRGLHWAQVAVQLSAFAGFGTVFLFLSGTCCPPSRGWPCLSWPRCSAIPIWRLPIRRCSMSDGSEPGGETPRRT